MGKEKEEERKNMEMCLAAFRDSNKYILPKHADNFFLNFFLFKVNYCCSKLNEFGETSNGF